MKPLDFDQTLDALAEQERAIARGIWEATNAMKAAEGLPFWGRIPLQWRGRRLIARGTRHLLRIRVHRDWMLEQEETLRPDLARRAVWNPR